MLDRGANGGFSAAYFLSFFPMARVAAVEEGANFAAGRSNTGVRRGQSAHGAPDAAWINRSAAPPWDRRAWRGAREDTRPRARPE